MAHIDNNFTFTGTLADFGHDADFPYVVVRDNVGTLVDFVVDPDEYWYMQEELGPLNLTRPIKAHVRGHICVAGLYAEEVNVSYMRLVEQA